MQSNVNQNIEVRVQMEKGMYARLVERAQDLGVPLSAVVRDSVVQYFSDIPEAPEGSNAVANPDDSIWELPTLSKSYGNLSTFSPEAVKVEMEDLEGRG